MIYSKGLCRLRALLFLPRTWAQGNCDSLSTYWSFL